MICLDQQRNKMMIKGKEPARTIEKDNFGNNQNRSSSLNKPNGIRFDKSSYEPKNIKKAQEVISNNQNSYAKRKIDFEPDATPINVPDAFMKTKYAGQYTYEIKENIHEDADENEMRRT